MKGTPAWSEYFAEDRLKMLSHVSLLDNITREWAWEGGTGKGIKVAVIDSGIDAMHPALAGQVDGYVTIITDKEGGITYDLSPHQDDFGHGTACAGIIRSIAPECEIYSIKVLGASLSGRANVFIAGLRWAIENGMHVCNLSLGTNKKDFFGILHELVDLAYFRNVILVAAANNLPVPLFPSVYASVISVASHAVQDPYCFYYNPEPPIEFGALGINVRVPWLKQGWVTSTGNSYATPHMAGIITRILSKNPTLTPFQVKTVLCALATNVNYSQQDR